MTEQPLTADTFQQALTGLIQRDPDLEGIVIAAGEPPFSVREPGFATLIQIILEQQVSLASGKAVFKRLQERINPLTPERFLSFDDHQLKGVGFSRQKLAYCRNVSRAIVQGDLPIERLREMDPEDIFHSLTAIKGIGPWTAETYMLLALALPDVIPAGDMALATAIMEIKSLPRLPSAKEIYLLSEPWKPWRSVATRLLWHYYLTTRNSTITNM